MDYRSLPGFDWFQQNVYKPFQYMANGPQAPDWRQLANTQASMENAQIDRQTALNRPNQYSPFGSVTWENGKQVTRLNPGDQRNLDLGRQLGSNLLFGARNLQNRGLDLGALPEMGGRFDPSALPGMGARFDPSALPQMGDRLNLGALPGLGSGDEVRNRAESSLFGRMSARLDPMWDQRAKSLETNLLNKGLEPGSEAYKNAMNEFSQQRNDAYSSAMNDAVTLGGTEASRLFGMDAQRRQMGLGEQQAAFGVDQARRAMGGNEYQLGFNADQARRAMGADEWQMGFNADQARHATGLGDQMARQQFDINKLNAGLNVMQGTRPGMPQMSPFAMAGLGATPNLMGAEQMKYGGDVSKWQGAWGRLNEGVGTLGSTIGSIGQTAGSLFGMGFNPFGGGGGGGARGPMPTMGPYNPYYGPGPYGPYQL